jgi:sirohydrochlorin ferrochelatase
MTTPKLPLTQSLELLLELQCGVLLVGHGTRKQSGQSEFKLLFSQFEPLMRPLACEMAFLELAEPSIEQAVERLVEIRQIKCLLVVPALLFTAGHAENDIPEMVQMAARRFGIQCFGQTDSLECSPEVVDLSAVRFRQAVCGSNCHSECSGLVCPDIAWINVGRGSSSPSAAQQMRELTDLRVARTPVRHASPAFVFGQSPSVPEAFDWASRLNIRQVVVQPHLLFSGLVLDQLKQQVNQCQLQNVHQKWTITETLGADRQLAELLARRAAQKLENLANN